METNLAKVYTIDWFINKFEAIPEELWIVGYQGEQEELLQKPHCALGHCFNDEGYLGNALAGNSTEAFHLVKLFENLADGPQRHRSNYLLVDINNGLEDRYHQPTPKQRILAALYDIKKLQSERQL